MCQNLQGERESKQSNQDNTIQMMEILIIIDELKF